jgi:large subunit ribosomal protein L10
MALTKKEKIQLVAEYEDLIKNADNIVVLSYEAIPVSVAVELRKEFKVNDSTYKVVKKKVFARALEQTWHEVNFEEYKLPMSVLFLKGDGISALKVVEKHLKEWKKEKLPYKLSYIGGYFEGKWQGADYVKTLASLPSKEELIGKFLYMVKYPIQWFVTVNSNLLSWFVRVLDQIKEKKS